MISHLKDGYAALRHENFSIISMQAAAQPYGHTSRALHPALQLYCSIAKAAVHTFLVLHANRSSHGVLTGIIWRPLACHFLRVSILSYPNIRHASAIQQSQVFWHSCHHPPLVCKLGRQFSVRCAHKKLTVLLFSTSVKAPYKSFISVLPTTEVYTALSAYNAGAGQEEDAALSVADSCGNHSVSICLFPPSYIPPTDHF